MMKYELKNVVAQSLPETRSVDGKETYGLPVVITTKIADQPYAGFENCEVAFCPIDKEDGTTAAEAKMLAFAQNFVAEKYPNT